MKFDVPDHAKYRILERGIDVDDAKHIIKSAKSRKIQPAGKIVVTGKSSTGRTLSVVYVQKSKNQFVIITGYYED
jgi:hypothetical protein